MRPALINDGRRPDPSASFDDDVSRNGRSGREIDEIVQFAIVGYGGIKVDRAEVADCDTAGHARTGEDDRPSRLLHSLALRTSEAGVGMDERGKSHAGPQADRRRGPRRVVAYAHCEIGVAAKEPLVLNDHIRLVRPGRFGLRSGDEHRPVAHRKGDVRNVRGMSRDAKYVQVSIQR